MFSTPMGVPLELPTQLSMSVNMILVPYIYTFSMSLPFSHKKQNIEVISKHGHLV